jgi:hypothetical protein
VLLALVRWYLRSPAVGVASPNRHRTTQRDRRRRSVDGGRGCGRDAEELSAERVMGRRLAGEKWVAIHPTVAHTRVMVVVLILLGLLIAAGIASICGWTVDTRDPEYSMGRLIPPDATNPPSNR